MKKDIWKYRWVILAAACIINVLAGILYAWSVLSAPMEEYLNLKYGLALAPGGLALAYSVFNFMTPVGMVLTGRINDRFGPKYIVLAGGILFGIGMQVCAHASSVAMMVVGFGIMCGLGLNSIYGNIVSNTVKFFPDHRGLAGGIVTGTYALSSMIISPIANHCIDSMGVTRTFSVLGIVYGGLLCIFAFFMIRCPEEILGSTSRENQNASIRNYDWYEMLKTPRFYMLFIMFLCGTVPTLMFVSQTTAIAQNMVALSAGSAALMVSVLCAFNGLSRIFLGSASDKAGTIPVVLAGFILSAAGLICLVIAHEGSTGLFVVSIGCLGLSMGVFMGLYPAITADAFGPAHSSINYAFMILATSISAFLGPAILRHSYQTTGGYNQAFVMALCFSAAGIVLAAFYMKKYGKGK